MKPCYIDLHIHTSENPNCINTSYDVNKLTEKIRSFSKTDNYLISLTDHNTINKYAYSELFERKINCLVGAELHIKIEGGKKPYHCHIYFNNVSSVKEIEIINAILDELYPDKIIGPNDEVPSLENIISKFDEYDFLLLPHAGQSHNTFDEAIPKGKRLDSIIEKDIYYNFFDGFTSRNNKGINRTKEYFKKLGIASFVNLITCSDNYEPSKYPDSKNSNYEFIPTWMLSEPTFAGLRLSLSEESRLRYQIEEPELSGDYIKNVKLMKDKIAIDVDLSQGLNIVIGGSSTGKTLFVDSIYRRINGNDFDNSNYLNFEVDKIEIDNPGSNLPHYIYQNYISTTINKKGEEGIEKIDILKYLFPNTLDLDNEANNQLIKLKKCINELVDSVETIEKTSNIIKNIQAFPRLLTIDNVKPNPYSAIKPTEDDITKVDFLPSEIQNYIETLDKISEFSKTNPLMNNVEDYTNKIKEEFEALKERKHIFDDLNSIISDAENEFNELESTGKERDKRNKEILKSLILNISKYISSLDKFKTTLEELSNFHFVYTSSSVKSQGHTLYIENDFKLDKEVILEEINYLLKNKIKSFNAINPSCLLSNNHSQRPKVIDYSDFKNKLFNRIAEKNKKLYRIVTSDGRDFDKLSPGWKTAIILDIILGYEKDNATIIIDQPEDNLAANYINDYLIDAIKKCKKTHQIIIVTHNATIPMLADAQNVILCQRNESNNRIEINSCSLEGNINGVTAIDYIANLTDGGKQSIKKRYKKYDLKRFKED